MALIKSIHGISPRFGTDCYLAETATIIGQVTLGNNCSVWFNAVIRGDVHTITIGDNTNVQDNAIIHCTYQQAKAVIGSNVTIAHRAIVHGCTLEDNVMVGMGAIVMDHAVVKSGALIAAGSVVLENTIVEGNSVYAGIPAKKIKKLGPENKAMMERIAANYVKYAGWYKDR